MNLSLDTYRKTSSHQTSENIGRSSIVVGDAGSIPIGLAAIATILVIGLLAITIVGLPLAIIVLFQHDIRRALARVGRFGLFFSAEQEESAMVEEVLGGNRNWLWLLGTRRIGKTSMLNCVSGRYHPQQGNILFKGEPITQLKPNQRWASNRFWRCAARI